MAAQTLVENLIWNNSLIDILTEYLVKSSTTKIYTSEKIPHISFTEDVSFYKHSSW